MDSWIFINILYFELRCNIMLFVIVAPFVPTLTICYLCPLDILPPLFYLLYTFLFMTLQDAVVSLCCVSKKKLENCIRNKIWAQGVQSVFFFLSYILFVWGELFSVGHCWRNGS